MVSNEFIKAADIEAEIGGAIACGGGVTRTVGAMEQVLVFPADRLSIFYQDFESFDGVVTDSKLASVVLANVLDGSSLRFMDRQAAESDPDFKQVIPYCVLSHDVKYFVYRRTKKGGENRLHDKWSIGVGGHINPEDGEPADAFTYRRGVLRELFEETGLLFKTAHFLKDQLALIYDPSDEVGKVHFGIAHLVPVGDPSRLAFKDPAMSCGEWWSAGSLIKQAGVFESWSNLLIQHSWL